MGRDDISGEELDNVRALVAREDVRADDRPDLTGQLQRLCRAAVTALPARGVGLSVMSEGAQVSLAASDDEHEAIEELQFTLGEGPCVDAYRSGGPVLVPDLAAAAGTRWPGYASAVQDHGVRAVFAFPLQVGGARLGALDVYQARAGPLATHAVAQAITFAEVALQTLLDAQWRHGETAGSDGIHAGVLASDGRPEVYQAQGMVMIQLGIGLAEAMTRLRAHAYAHDRPLSDVAADIIARKLTLGDDSDRE